MAEGRAELHSIVDDIMRAGGAGEESWPDPGLRASLHGLAADDPQPITAGLSCLWASFIEYPNVFEPAVPAVRYVLALLDRKAGGDTVVRSPDGRLRPLRGHLLTWLAAAADAVGDVRVREFAELAGRSPLEHPGSAWHGVRLLRSRMYVAAAALLDDPDPGVRQEAIAAAVVLVRAPELAAHRERIAAAARAFLDACTDPQRRRWAEAAFRELSAATRTSAEPGVVRYR
ncbi:hypothetical protein [Dactylosporangium matsuzakiense]|uniref:hypothetical protein n=1 Tax=Dactylosporangium matsuzakiense TaxID=53360 RepID=UPI0021C2F907|nr:hypothetical protein [Dactylosporangium matsuzakiense]UWZ41265.1 hypothetical protein Dmats_26690 [Dactylosporangium matsuzakiense]